jgi:hypothetical protein
MPTLPAAPPALPDFDSSLTDPIKRFCSAFTRLVAVKDVLVQTPANLIDSELVLDFFNLLVSRIFPFLSPIQLICCPQDEIDEITERLSKLPGPQRGLNFSPMQPWINELAHISHSSMRRLGRILPNLQAQIQSLTSTIDLDPNEDEDNAEEEFDVIKIESRPPRKRGAASKVSADQFPFLATHPVSPKSTSSVAKRAKENSLVRSLL